MTKNHLPYFILCASLFCIAFQGFAQETNKLDPQKINALVSTKIAMDKSGDFKDRFTIQLYYGDREAAIATKNSYDRLGLPWASELKWESPFHKIWVGKYRNRLEADRALITIRTTYKDAFILKP